LKKFQRKKRKIFGKNNKIFEKKRRFFPNFAHFLGIFTLFLYKSTIYTFVIWEKIWTPPLCCTKVPWVLLCFGSRKHPPTPYMSGTFGLAPPPHSGDPCCHLAKNRNFKFLYIHANHNLDKISGTMLFR
jgi:hypothetical protein